jgi:hypothetical protein
VADAIGIADLEVRAVRDLEVPVRAVAFAKEDAAEIVSKASVKADPGKADPAKAGTEVAVTIAGEEDAAMIAHAMIVGTIAVPARLARTRPLPV